jgi:hypothetical protein
MIKYLATYTDTINNLDIFGFMVMSDKDMERYESLATSITWSFSYNISEFDYLDFIDGEDYLSRIEFKEITDDEYISIKNVFGPKFGTFIDEEHIKIVLSGDEINDEDFLDDSDDRDENNFFSNLGDDY